MKFLDLVEENKFFSDNIQKEFSKVYDSGSYLLGPQLLRLENSFAQHIGKPYAVGVKNCTDAIMMLVKHLLKPDMPIVLPNFGANPTSVACRNLTDNIYYVDVDESMTINPDKLPDVKNGIVIPVHLFGNNCQIKKIKDYCKQNNHVLIEDCAQSTGSGSGKDGDYSVFSFYPTKPLGSMGDGGMICLNSFEESEFFKKFRFYGQDKGRIEFPGINSRMDEFQASVVLAKINSYQKMNDKRIEIANRYKKIIRGYRVSSKSVYHIFSVLFTDRDKVISVLNEKQIPYMIHYPHHVSELPSLQGKNKSTVGFRVSDKIVSLPCHPFLTESDIQKVEEFLSLVKDQEYV